MASKQTRPIETNVIHDGEEKAVRSRSQHSRSAHVPATDDDGNVVYDDNGRPVPKCGQKTKTDTEWVLRSVRNVSFRDRCNYCFEHDDTSDQNRQNGGSASFARRMRYGSDWGSDE